MTTQSAALPERPHLGQLKQQAKELLRAARASDDAAQARFRQLPAFADLDAAALATRRIALHDAQSVIAREHGFTSWNALREHVEDRTLAFDAAVNAFVEAATDGRRDRALRLLALHPGIAHAGLAPSLVLGDIDAATQLLDPESATRPTGARDWLPLHYLCHTCLAATDPRRAEGIVTLARRLLELGADPHTRFPWEHHGVKRGVLWGAICTTRLLPLAEVLLDAGADPNDGVTLTLAAMSGDTAALDLLHRHGATVDTPWATDGSAPLYAQLQWTGTTAGTRWLLEHDADPNQLNGEQQETVAHLAARRSGPEVFELLATHGADFQRARRDGRTPYALACLNGNTAAADWLRAHDAESDLATIDRFTAVAAQGDRETARTLADNHPGLLDQLTAEHTRVLFQLAENGDGDGLAAMLECGFDASPVDPADGRTPLHAAAYAGKPATVRVLIEHGASLTALDREFKAQALIWAAEGCRTYANDPTERDHRAVAQLLLAAGSPTAWESNGEPPQPIMEILEDWLEAPR